MIMKHISNFIVNNRKVILVIFLVLTVFCGFLIPSVTINYDQTKYLPSDSDTAQGFDVLKNEFGDIGTVNVMIKNVDLVEAAGVSKQLSAIDNVTQVIFLDTMLSSMVDEDKIDVTLDLLQILFKLQTDLFPSRSLSYIFNLALEGAKEIVSLFPDIKWEDTALADFDPKMFDQLEGYYVNNCALIMITLAENDYADSTKIAIDQIIEVSSKYDSYYTGTSAMFYFDRQDASSEMIFLTIFALAVVLVILFISTKSYIEPLIYFIVIVVAIILNLGTNIFLGEITDIAFIVGALLQFALSMDYSIFLLHSYQAEKKKTLDNNQAMKNALAKSLSPISASSLTTIAGFVALMFMQFTIGLNFGLVLAKGIVLSLICTFFVMPGIVLGLNNAMEDTAHDSLFGWIRKSRQRRREKAHKTAMEETGVQTPMKVKRPFLDKYTNGIMKMKHIVPVLFVILLIPMFVFQQSNNFFFGNAPEGSTSTTYLSNSAEIAEVFGIQNQGVIMIANKHLDKEMEVAGNLQKFDFVKSIQSYTTVAEMMTGEIPDEVTYNFRGDNYYRIIVAFDFVDESQYSFECVEMVDAVILRTLGDADDYFFLGSTKSVYEISKFSLSDNLLISMLTLLFILIILAATFKSVAITLILGIIIQGCVWINMAIPYIMGNAMQFIGYTIVSGIQMGATIDYGILLTNNYLNARRTKGKRASIREALRVSVPSILVGGSILACLGILLGIISSSVTTAVIGMALGRGAIVSLIGMLFILPQALVLCDGFIRKTTYKGKQKMMDEKAEQQKLKEAIAESTAIEVAKDTKEITEKETESEKTTNIET